MSDESAIGIPSLRRLIVWQRAMDLAVEVYAITRTFPREEAFGLTVQIRRAVVSVPSNIAEGVERVTLAERRRFLVIARSSLAELETQLELAVRFEFVEERRTTRARALSDHVGRMLTKMIRNIRAAPAKR
jgi:four helix bundle protein